MLIRSHDDSSDDEDRWRPFVESQGFGHLVAAGVDRPVPVVVPTQFVLRENTIVLHLAKSNPIFDCLAENDQVLLSVAGNWAYIPGAWKAVGDEDPRVGVPTTYYAAVQLTGTATVMDEPAATAGVLREQLAALEPDGDYIDPIEHGAKLPTIRGLSIVITDVRAKFKYGGNVDDVHRTHIAEQLDARSGPGDAAARAQIDV